MSMKEASASNWVAEKANATDAGFTLLGTSKGYASFSRAFQPSQDVFYSASDESGNREAGFAKFDGSNLVLRQPTATLVNGIYTSPTPPRVSFVGQVTVACTFNAAAFNTLWKAFQSFDPDGDGDINIPPELIDGLGEALAGKADQSALEDEIKARKDGDASLQGQIDALEIPNIDGLASEEWVTDQIDAIPETDLSEYAKTDYVDAADDALQSQIDDLAGGGIDLDPVRWSDITEKPESIQTLGVSNLINGGTF